jgi:hypothetical protein
MGLRARPPWTSSSVYVPWVDAAGVERASLGVTHQPSFGQRTYPRLSTQSVNPTPVRWLVPSGDLLKPGQLSVGHVP